VQQWRVHECSGECTSAVRCVSLSSAVRAARLRQHRPLGDQTHRHVLSVSEAVPEERRELKEPRLDLLARRQRHPGLMPLACPCTSMRERRSTHVARDGDTRLSQGVIERESTLSLLFPLG
jgi:hypothetical protein